MRGVKYIGPFNDYSGYGEASRNYILALNRAGVPLTIEGRCFDKNPPTTGTKEEREIINSLVSKQIDYDVVIVHLTPDLAPYYIDAHPGKYVINYTVWETSRLHPLWAESCNKSDEIWVPCDWNVASFRESGVSKPIFKMPHGISLDYFEGYSGDNFSIGGVDKSNTFLFYSILQWNYRKNPEALFKAYFNAFTPEDNVALILKAYVGRGMPQEEEARQIKEVVGRLKKDLGLPYYPPVKLITEVLSTDKMKALHLYGDAYVSLTRGEGWGLPMMEAGLAGNPVIATGMGGNMEFMSAENSFPIDFMWTYVSGMSSFNNWYLGNQRWAEPDVIHAARLMKEVYLNRKAAKEKALLLQQRIKQEFNWDATASLMVKRLQEL